MFESTGYYGRAGVFDPTGYYWIWRNGVFDSNGYYWRDGVRDSTGYYWGVGG